MSVDSKPLPEVHRFSDIAQAAQTFFIFGFQVIPVNPGTKATAARWDEWLSGLSLPRIKACWRHQPALDLGVIVGDKCIVFDADSPESLAALYDAEARFEVDPAFVVKTKHGEHHYFKLAAGTVAKTVVHSTKDFPDRVDVKTGRTLVVLPPSTDKHITKLTVQHASALSEAPQAFIDALSGQAPRLSPTPQAPDAAVQPRTPLPVLQACIDKLDPDMGHQNWFRVAAVLHHETGGSADGFKLFDTWSAGGGKYKGATDTGRVWKSIKPGCAKPATMGTLRFLLREAGHNWFDIQAEVDGATEAGAGAA
jgi:hypothetical protein